MTADATPLAPEARAVGTPRGTATTLGDGLAWTLSDAVPPGGVFDALYDQNVARGVYDVGQLRTAAYRLLRANYRLSPDEAFALIRDIEPADLVEPVENALFGSPRENWTYSMWIEASLLLAGVNPATAPPRLIRMMMEILERTKRTIPEAEGISVQAAMAKRTKILNFDRG